MDSYSSALEVPRPFLSMHEFYLFYFQRHSLLARIQESVKVSDFFIAEWWEGGGLWGRNPVARWELCKGGRRG